MGAGGKDGKAGTTAPGSYGKGGAGYDVFVPPNNFGRLL